VPAPGALRPPDTRACAAQGNPLQACRSGLLDRALGRRGRQRPANPQAETRGKLSLFVACAGLALTWPNATAIGTGRARMGFVPQIYQHQSIAGHLAPYALPNPITMGRASRGSDSRASWISNYSQSDAGRLGPAKGIARRVCSRCALLAGRTLVIRFARHQRISRCRRGDGVHAPLLSAPPRPFPAPALPPPLPFSRCPGAICWLRLPGGLPR